MSQQHVQEAFNALIKENDIAGDKGESQLVKYNAAYSAAVTSKAVPPTFAIWLQGEQDKAKAAGKPSDVSVPADLAKVTAVADKFFTAETLTKLNALPDAPAKPAAAPEAGAAKGAAAPSTTPPEVEKTPAEKAAEEEEKKKKSTGGAGEFAKNNGGLILGGIAAVISMLTGGTWLVTAIVAIAAFFIADNFKDQIGGFVGDMTGGKKDKTVEQAKERELEVVSATIKKDLKVDVSTTELKGADANKDNSLDRAEMKTAIEAARKAHNPDITYAPTDLDKTINTVVPTAGIPLAVAAGPSK